MLFEKTFSVFSEKKSIGGPGLDWSLPPLFWGAAPGTLGAVAYRSVKMFQIESGVEMPVGRTKYPFADMHPGDSIRFGNEKLANSARVSAMRFVRAHAPDWSFQLRRVENGWRLWRVA
jgi:hypothetical protein